MNSKLGIKYDLIAALRRNPTIIQAGDDICAVAADEIKRLRDVVEAAYINGALDFGGFSQAVADRALERFPVSDAFRWREDPDEWADDQSDKGTT